MTTSAFDLQMAAERRFGEALNRRVAELMRSGVQFGSAVELARRELGMSAHKMVHIVDEAERGHRHFKRFPR